MISIATNQASTTNSARNAVRSKKSADLGEISEKKVDLQDCYIMKKTRLIRVKTPEEVKFLESQFEKDPEWTRKTVQYWKEVLNLGTTQIYKWGFDKKLSVERRMKKLLKKNKSKTKPRGRKGVKRSRKSCNSKNTQKPKQMKVEESSGLGDALLPKLAVSRIDYNLEVARLISEETIYADSGDNWRSDTSDQKYRQKEQSKSLDMKFWVESQRTVKDSQESPKANSNAGASTLQDSWLDEIWDESFDADQYLSSTSDMFQETPFLMESDFMRSDPPLVQTASIPKLW